MAKGIIVVDDIPVICAECVFASLKINGQYMWCNVKHEFCNNSKPDWCPIKPIKRKPREARYQNEFEKGWNACIDEILKGAKNNE